MLLPKHLGLHKRVVELFEAELLGLLVKSQIEGNVCRLLSKLNFTDLNHPPRLYPVFLI